MLNTLVDKLQFYDLNQNFLFSVWVAVVKIACLTNLKCTIDWMVLMFNIFIAGVIFSNDLSHGCRIWGALEAPLPGNFK
jgi:hypothetical protein